MGWKEKRENDGVESEIWRTVRKKPSYPTTVSFFSGFA